MHVLNYLLFTIYALSSIRRFLVIRLTSCGKGQNQPPSHRQHHRLEHPARFPASLLQPPLCSHNQHPAPYFIHAHPAPRASAIERHRNSHRSSTAGACLSITPSHTGTAKKWLAEGVFTAHMRRDTHLRRAWRSSSACPSLHTSCPASQGAARLPFALATIPLLGDHPLMRGSRFATYSSSCPQQRRPPTSFAQVRKSVGLAGSRVEAFAKAVWRDHIRAREVSLATSSIQLKVSLAGFCAASLCCIHLQTSQK